MSMFDAIVFMYVTGVAVTAVVTGNIMADVPARPITDKLAIGAAVAVGWPIALVVLLVRGVWLLLPKRAKRVTVPHARARYTKDVDV